jgi:hypothetical protein
MHRGQLLPNHHHHHHHHHHHPPHPTAGMLTTYGVGNHSYIHTYIQAEESWSLARASSTHLSDSPRSQIQSSQKSKYDLTPPHTPTPPDLDGGPGLGPSRALPTSLNMPTHSMILWLMGALKRERK